MSFRGKVVIVTGASAGIGAVTAEWFSREGANVALVARNEEKLQQVAAQCTVRGSPPLVIKADVTNDEDAKRIVQTTVKHFGKIDVLVNNAGIITYGTCLDGNMLRAYDKVMPINVRAVIHLTVLAAPYLVKTKGNIVNVSSVAGVYVAHKTCTAYCTSKACLDMFTRGTASELAPSGVRVNAVSPGPVATGIFVATDPVPEGLAEVNHTPLGVGQCEDIADIILYLASDKAKGITGSNFYCDRGFLLK